MTNSPSIHGIIAYPVTPFTADGDGIDTGKLAALVDRLVTDGAHAIAPLGSTGESAYLTEPEFDTVVDITVDVVDGRVPVIVGASDLTTANTIRRARHAQRAGADALMILPVSRAPVPTVPPGRGTIFDAIIARPPRAEDLH